MAQPLSEHDEDFGSLDDFAPEEPAVQARHADFAPEQPAVQRDTPTSRLSCWPSSRYTPTSSRSHCSPQTPGATRETLLLVRRNSRTPHRRRRVAWLAGDPASSGSQ